MKANLSTGVVGTRERSNKLATGQYPIGEHDYEEIKDWQDRTDGLRRKLHKCRKCPYRVVWIWCIDCGQSIFPPEMYLSHWMNCQGQESG